MGVHRHRRPESFDSYQQIARIPKIFKYNCVIVVAMVAIAVFDKLNNNNNIHSTYIKYSNNIRQLYLMDVVFAIVRKRCRSWSAIVVAIHRQSLCVSAAVANVYIYTNLSTYILFEN